MYKKERGPYKNRFDLPEAVKKKMKDLLKHSPRIQRGNRSSNGKLQKLQSL